jgi:hypothetical protein
MTKPENIVILEQQIKEHTDALAALRIELHKARQANAGIFEGVTVVSKEGHEFLVTAVESWSFGDPWVRGLKRKKDGDWSKVEQFIGGGYEIVVPA